MRKRKPTGSSASSSIAFLIIKIRALEKYSELPMATVVLFFRKATVVVVYYSASPKNEHNWAATVVCLQ
ncbi:hypothetical protein Tsubulata_020376 [Turnera subulata]|uniref:Uncharacterized protein n=1 Tax=Turnera subulata TaxID=218843 RepID=A0A9Q0FUT9_9ROSI|nr:hypothetical protein Tsubulata_020376 [Turnera subulata]